MMKRTTTLICSLLVAMCVMAQDNLGGFGFHVGYAAPTLRINTPTSKTPNTFIPMNGMKVGISYDATIVKGFGTTLGLNYTFATYHSKWISPSTTSTNQYSYRDSYHGLEIFCDWQYKFQIAGETYLMLYSGPTIQCHLSLNEQEYIRTSTETRKATDKETYYGYTYRDNESFEDYKRLNVTWGIGAGFQFRQFFVRGGYDFGLFNPYKISVFEKPSNPSADPQDYTYYYTRGRFDQWQVKLGMYIFQF